MVGREYMSGKLAQGRTIEGYVGAGCLLPAHQDMQLETELRLPVEQPTFLDRAFPDCLTFFRSPGWTRTRFCRNASIISMPPSLCSTGPFPTGGVRNRGDAESSFAEGGSPAIMVPWIFRCEGACLSPGSARLVLERLSEQGLI